MTRSTELPLVAIFVLDGRMSFRDMLADQRMRGRSNDVPAPESDWSHRPPVTLMSFRKTHSRWRLMGDGVVAASGPVVGETAQESAAEPERGRGQLIRELSANEALYGRRHGL